MSHPDFPLRVRHAAGSYPIHLGDGALARLPSLLAELCPGARPALISDDKVIACVRPGIAAQSFTFPAGEASKSRETWAALTDRLLAAGFGRDSVIVALGGGVVGDVAGFVAATYHRGLPLVQVPTSLLAMVDASIGGKTGIDTAAGKNLVGAFHQPTAVLIDPLVLQTLPDQEFRAGLAEVIKHALIADRAHFGWLAANMAAILARDPIARDRMLRVSVALKAAVVAEDEREAGRRAVLNAGHSVAHAIEACSDWGVHHGEAVAMGLVIEARAGEQLGVTEAGTCDALEELLRAAGLPTVLPSHLSTDAVVEALRFDKKNRGGELRVSLPARIGAMHRAPGGEWTTALDPGVLRSALQA